MANWTLITKKADFAAIADEFGISPVTARLIRNRDVMGPEELRLYLHGGLADMHDPFLLRGMAEALPILAEKIEQAKTLRVIGDYDADGICAAAILLKGFRALGADVDTVIPHRMKDGYGLNDDMIQEAAAAGMDTIVTCDNGIAAVSAVRLAKEQGMSVIITDHHAIQDSLPPADATICPKQPDCPYPNKEICGAGVALKLIEALYHHMEKQLPEDMKKELYCLAAIATVCDVMELRGENRILVKYGLKHLGDCINPGISALLEVNGLSDKELSSYHLGYIIGPCLNATGRLDTAERALGLLMAGDYRTAINIAADLKSLNESRKEMTQKNVEAAIALVEKMFHADAPEMFHAAADGVDSRTAAGRDHLDKVLVLYLPDCHESLAGIVAGRIRERFCRPCFILTPAEDGIKGSGRGMDAYHMFDEMCKVKDLFSKYGGHKLAAGLSMPKENMEKFRRLINENAQLSAEDFEEKIAIDIALPFKYATKQLCEELKLLEPFGKGNIKPLFAQKDVCLVSGRLMGKTGRAARYEVADDEGGRHELIYFGDIAAFDLFLTEHYPKEQVEGLYLPQGAPSSGHNGITINLTYYPAINSYKGRESVQLVMQDYGKQKPPQ